MQSKSTLLGMFTISCLVALSTACAQSNPKYSKGSEKLETSKSDQPLESAIFGGGCFWCVEAVFENVQGVEDVISGYAGGELKDPNYKQVCTGRTGHAEVCEIKFDPAEVSFKELLEIFWKTHDPTTLNRQGADVGTQYRSVVFYTSEEQKSIAETYMKKLDESGAYPSKLVTEISPAPKFYVAEDYHQDYYRKNPGAGYCAAVVRPKVEKFKAVFAEKVKTPE